MIKGKIMVNKKKNLAAAKKPSARKARPAEPKKRKQESTHTQEKLAIHNPDEKSVTTEEKRLTPPERYYEKLNLESYEGFVAMIDRMFFKLTGKTSKRTPKEEAEMRAGFEKMRADHEKKQAALKKQQESRD